MPRLVLNPHTQPPSHLSLLQLRLQAGAINPVVPPSFKGAKPHYWEVRHRQHAWPSTPVSRLPAQRAQQRAEASLASSSYASSFQPAACSWVRGRPRQGLQVQLSLPSSATTSAAWTLSPFHPPAPHRSSSVPSRAFCSLPRPGSVLSSSLLCDASLLGPPEPPAQSFFFPSRMLQKVPSWTPQASVCRRRGAPPQQHRGSQGPGAGAEPGRAPPPPASCCPHLSVGLSASLLRPAVLSAEER